MPETERPKKYVSVETGSDLNDGSEASPWKTLQHAVNNADEEDTIVVLAGEYVEDEISITKNDLVIQGPNEKNAGYDERLPEAVIRTKDEKASFKVEGGQISLVGLQFKPQDFEEGASVGAPILVTGNEVTFENNIINCAIEQAGDELVFQQNLVANFDEDSENIKDALTSGTGQYSSWDIKQNVFNGSSSGPKRAVVIQGSGTEVSELAIEDNTFMFLPKTALQFKDDSDASVDFSVSKNVFRGLGYSVPVGDNVAITVSDEAKIDYKKIVENTFEDVASALRVSATAPDADSDADDIKEVNVFTNVDENDIVSVDTDGLDLQDKVFTIKLFEEKDFENKGITSVAIRLSAGPVARSLINIKDSALNVENFENQGFIELTPSGFFATIQDITTDLNKTSGSFTLSARVAPAAELKFNLPFKFTAFTTDGTTVEDLSFTIEDISQETNDEIVEEPESPTRIWEQLVDGTEADFQLAVAQSEENRLLAEGNRDPVGLAQLRNRVRDFRQTVKDAFELNTNEKGETTAGSLAVRGVVDNKVVNILEAKGDRTTFRGVNDFRTEDFVITRDVDTTDPVRESEDKQFDINFKTDGLVERSVVFLTPQPGQEAPGFNVTTGDPVPLNNFGPLADAGSFAGVKWDNGSDFDWELPYEQPAAWSSEVEYSEGNLVSVVADNKVYRSKVDENEDNVPKDSPEEWEDLGRFVPKSEYREKPVNEWQGSQLYNEGDYVFREGSGGNLVYRALKDVPQGIDPSDTANLGVFWSPPAASKLTLYHHQTDWWGQYPQPFSLVRPSGGSMRMRNLNKITYTFDTANTDITKGGVYVRIYTVPLGDGNDKESWYRSNYRVKTIITSLASDGKVTLNLQFPRNAKEENTNDNYQPRGDNPADSQSRFDTLYEGADDVILAISLQSNSALGFNASKVAIKTIDPQFREGGTMHELRNNEEKTVVRSSDTGRVTGTVFNGDVVNARGALQASEIRIPPNPDSGERTLRLLGSLGVSNELTANAVVSRSVTAFSDARLKKNIAPIDHALEKIRMINGVYYNWIKGGPRQLGVIAQNVQTVVPELVKDSGEHLSVSYGNMTALLVEGMKTLDERLRAVEKKLA